MGGRDSRTEARLARRRDGEGPSGVGTIILDRRRFLQLAVASAGAAAFASLGWHLADAQDDGATGSTAPSAVTDIVTAMAATLGHDPARIYRFVADEIRYEPYAGILRGANGALVARAGNSADQALLLAGLLQASRIPVRFVTGTLDEAGAASLMATTVLDAEAARERVLQSLLSDEDVATGIEWTVLGGATPTEVAELLDLAPLRTALEQDRERLGPLAGRYVSDAIDTIAAALAGAGIELPASGVSALPALERERHTWVQMDDGSGWLDLDPAFGALQPGDAATTVAETLEALPDELRHIVDFTVIAETYTGGILAQEPILEVSAFADELAYRGLVFGHALAEDVEGLGGIDIIGTGLADGTRYNPVLVVGPEALVAQRPISIGSGGGGFADALGGGGGEGLVEGETSAEWLEVAVGSPGSEPVVARRAIFDRVGTALRESGSIDSYAIPAAEFVDLGDGLGAQYLPARSARAFSVTGATPDLRMLVQELGLDDVGWASLVTGLTDATRTLLGAELAASLGSLAFPDAPAVTSLLAEPTATGTTVGLDVWHRDFGTLGLAGVMPAVQPAMLAGVIPHAVERALLEGGPASADGSLGPAVGVGAVFEAAAAQGIPTRVYAGSIPADVAIDPQSHRLLQQAIDAGRLVIVPERPVDLGGRPRLGWWLVDPVSGAAVDQMDDGGGIGTAEYVTAIVAGAVLLTGLALLLDYAKKFVIRGEEPSASPIEQNWMRDAANRADQARRREAIEQGAVRFRLNQYPTSSAGSP